jgi:HSP20 family protein
MANLVLGHVSPLSWTGFRDDVFGRLESEMDRLLTDMINPKSIQRMKGDHYPKTDIYRKAHNLHFELAVPFVKKEDITITLENGLLTVRGVSQADTDETKDEYYLAKEIRRSAWTRSWQLPDRADLSFTEDDIVATLEDGILSIIVTDYFVDEVKKPVKKEIKIK